MRDASSTCHSCLPKCAASKIDLPGCFGAVVAKLAAKVNGRDQWSLLSIFCIGFSTGSLHDSAKAGSAGELVRTWTETSLLWDDE